MKYKKRRLRYKDLLALGYSDLIIWILVIIFGIASYKLSNAVYTDNFLINTQLEEIRFKLVNSLTLYHLFLFSSLIISTPLRLIIFGVRQKNYSTITPENQVLQLTD